MAKRNLEIEADTLDGLLVVMRGLAKQSRRMMRQLQNEGQFDPMFFAQALTINEIYRELKEANAQVEIADLEAILALDLDSNDNADNAEPTE
jgi:hypothetical protein